MKFIILGCGSSMGVPHSDGYFGNCDPKNKKNYRTRCSALIKSKKENILIDTSPDMRSQLLTNQINNIDRILYTHQHGDQTHGINDLRVFYLKKKKVLPIYADKKTSKYLKKTFSYCFKNNITKPASLNYPATLKINQLKKNHIFSDIKIKSIPVNHGNIDCMSFIINDKCAYASDVKFIYKKNIDSFKNLKYLVIDCLRFDKHPSHFNLDEVIALLKKINPKKTILTNLNTDMDYKILKKKLPKNIIPAYDGLTINL
ncbi:MBL fold metallo-hydrolase [Candidatus Pelagibacter bacterium]|nr:MBL fold metallo-hydrolase [Candidatus Pelagibacter bacterium]